jgi:hypothetical protein
LRLSLKYIERWAEIINVILPILCAKAGIMFILIGKEEVETEAVCLLKRNCFWKTVFFKKLDS